ncbi:nucleoside 2-deoxyribosyltransferase [Latilactobacillus sakei]|uniref:Nucleoside 2-deoxyribosyltransferase n=1 Tax=Latilactobacillus sakei TaxID=1599 RepID=A0AAX0V8M8_LATSK|nr:nucleoside 2-deoxyribosyltransferase [Latilactobacillus sakei]ASN12758.1 nucleoside 2-deoxyribosyltransferase [Latilactobacillus sakei]MCM1635123.1 nucleoside 2-deoxyribosyltransferase [Latilactobacillus sakei]PKX60470.1 nucleoside 2-deoxyribosyltransferase [Latilactobacillus sakei]PKX69280.1 nucleoside 2-deoxyribosyltransferase [Latilactobacillus sakei]PKX71061.1 nucleoside 2-deoxyribosyltransferase [Latilactobacillus sakei]
MSTNKKIYLAGPFFSPEQITRLDQIATLLAKNPTVATENIFRPNEHSYSDAEFGTFEWQTATFGFDIRQIDQADLVVAVLDYQTELGQFEPDSGTMWECGYAFAHNKPVILVRYKDDLPINLMLSGSATAIFNGEADLANLATYDFNTLQTKYVATKIF